jgi:hypothetical protein
MSRKFPFDSDFATTGKIYVSFHAMLVNSGMVIENILYISIVTRRSYQGKELEKMYEKIKDARKEGAFHGE